MTMPISDEQMSRELTSLKECVNDFRNEMRAALTGVVRQDVYQAQQETLRAQLNAQVDQLRTELTEMRGTMKTLLDEKRQNRGLVVSAMLSAALAVVMGLFNLK